MRRISDLADFEEFSLWSSKFDSQETADAEIICKKITSAGQSVSVKGNRWLKFQLGTLLPTNGEKGSDGLRMGPDLKHHVVGKERFLLQAHGLFYIYQHLDEYRYVHVPYAVLLFLFLSNSSPILVCLLCHKSTNLLTFPLSTASPTFKPIFLAFTTPPMTLYSMLSFVCPSHFIVHHSWA